MDKVYSEKQRNNIDLEFSWIHDKCYLDNAGAALYSTVQVQKIAADLCQNLYANPHSLNDAGRTCADAIDRIRFRVLQFFHTTPDDYSIIFTSGATAAIKLLLESFSFNDALPGSFVYTASNHTSIIGGRQLAADQGANIICLDMTAVEKLMNEPNQPQPDYFPRNSLFAYPAQCNFSGSKYPLDWVLQVQNGVLNNRPALDSESSKWYTLLDAAAYCSTNSLNLTKTRPDFVCVSFYKIFGYPTGLGALLVKNSSAAVLNKKYFGGGSVDIALPSRQFHQPRKSLHERFEDGTLPYLTIISLGHGLDTLERLHLSMKEISWHVFTLAQSAVHQMKNLRHWNREPLVEIYADSDFSHVSKQGGIVAFNLKRSDGSFIGYVEVLHVANSYKIQLRTGCFCNIGACQHYLAISDDHLLANYQSGHVCGDDKDIIKGKPTGAVRISFGLASSSTDITRLIHMLRETFLENEPIQKPNPSHMSEKPILESIRLYPVKSCSPMKVDSWLLTARGLYMDRQWMIISAAGVCLTQKQEPMLCRVMPEVQLDSDILTLTYNGSDPITVNQNQNDADEYHMCRNKVCGDKVDGVDCGDAVADWLSRHLGHEGLRLIRQHKDDKRVSKIEGFRGREQSTVGQLSLVNQAQYLMINSNSVDWLRERLQTEPDFDLTTLEDRFRANFVISGVTAFDELKWNQMQIGPVTFKVEGPCTRCQMICIDQQTGQKNRRPLVEISRALEGKLRFGIYCSHVNTGKLATLQTGNTVTYNY